MERLSDLLLNISLLYRNSSKYFDQKLLKYNLSYGQVIFLLLINENEGINSNGLSSITAFDKSTVTSAIKKLVNEEFVNVVENTDDKRVKNLYITQKSSMVINEIYQIRNDYYECLTDKVPNEVVSGIADIAKNSKHLEDIIDPYHDLKIGGIQKVSLLDYPGKVAATIFMGGCNYKCPFCHNADLVFLPADFELYKSSEVFEYLEKRKNVLDGVCVTGGEPLLQERTVDFIKTIKELGYLVKLDTNGFFPERLKYLIDNELIDYVAIDIKNSKDKYPETTGLNKSNFDISKIEESVEYLMNSSINYEFRTTVVDEFFEESDFEKIGKWIKGAKAYYLQGFVDSGNIIKKGLHPVEKERMEEYLSIVKKYVPNSHLRGIE